MSDRQIAQPAELRTVVARVVRAVEETFRMPGPRKKRLALRVAGDILAELGLQVPDLVLDSAIEASVQAMKLAEQGRVARPPELRKRARWSRKEVNPR